jgi:RHS repeat-associated protein
MLQPGRHSSSSSSDSYRYGFNGKEKDDEVKGSGNHLDFGARCYDPRIGRWFSIDAVEAAHQSPYAFVSNDVLRKYDPDGNWERDGHYWTVLLVATMLKLPNAAELAYWAEYPDQIMDRKLHIRDQSAKKTASYWKAEFRLTKHAFGGNFNDKKAYFDKWWAKSYNVIGKGKSVDYFGDMYSHIDWTDMETWKSQSPSMNPDMFNVTLGHGMQGYAPDKIKNRGTLYGHYIKDLVSFLGGEDASIDMSVFYNAASSGLDTEGNVGIFRVEYALLKSSKSIAFESKEEYDAGMNYMDTRGLKKNVSKFTGTVTTSKVDGKDVSTYKMDIEY